MRWMRWVALIVVVLASQASQTASADFADELPVAPGGTLHLEIERGSVEVLSHEAERVRVQVHSRGLGASSIRFRLAPTSNGASLTSTTDNWLEWLRGGPTIAVRAWVPRSFHVEVRTAAGDVRVASIDGNVLVRTSAGTVEIEKIHGSVDAETSGGSIATHEVEGDVSAETSGGRIDVHHVGGDVHAVTSGGRIFLGHVAGNAETITSGGPIEIDGLAGRVLARTSGGAVLARFTREPAGIVETSGGGIEVAFPAAAGAFLDALTLGGRVHVDHIGAEIASADPGRLVAPLNGGGEKLRLRTSGGSIRVRSH